MILGDDGEIESDNDESECEDMPTLEDVSNVEYVISSESLVIRRSLHVQVSEKVVEQQMDNIFHTRCHIKNKVYNMIIDNDSCTNIASKTLVRKLILITTKHATPYKLQWLNECREVMVTK
jgi:hypothetical protein